MHFTDRNIGADCTYIYIAFLTTVSSDYYPNKNVKIQVVLANPLSNLELDDVYLGCLGYVLDVDAYVDDRDGVVRRVELRVVHGDADAVPLCTELAAQTTPAINIPRL